MELQTHKLRSIPCYSLYVRKL